MSLPENTRLLHTNELPPLNTRVYVPENTAAVVGEPPAPGWQTIRATDESDNSIAVKSAKGHTSWVLSHNLLVDDEARPTVGDRVHINAPGERHHGKVGKIVEDDGTDLPYFVQFGHDGAEWFSPRQVSPVRDGDTFPGEAPTTVTITTHVTIPRQATAEQVADALGYVDGHHEVTVHTYADRIEIHAHHEETRG